MAGREGSSNGGSKGKGKAKAKPTVKWEEEIEDEEKSELALCLIGKLWTKRRFNSNAFMNTITKVWNPIRGVEAKEIDTNLFLFQFYHWKDLDKVVEGEPWFFDKSVVVLKPVMGGVKPSEMAESLTHAPFWVRIYDCPLEGRKEKRIKAMAESLGVPIKVDEGCVSGWTKSVRVKILMDLRDPFTDEITLEKGNGQEITLPVKYERLPNICYFCGRVGHVERDCEAKEEDGEGGNTYGFGEWMRASPWRAVKEGNRKNLENTNIARRLVFKPQTASEGDWNPSVDKMAESLLKVKFQGDESSKSQGKEACHDTGKSNDCEVEREESTCKEAMEAPISTNQKKGTWQRIKRTLEEGPKQSNGMTSVTGKRFAGEADLIETGIMKKLRQDDVSKEDHFLAQAETAQQSRRAP